MKWRGKVNDTTDFGRNQRRKEVLTFDADVEQVHSEADGCGDAGDEQRRRGGFGHPGVPQHNASVTIKDDQAYFTVVKDGAQEWCGRADRGSLSCFASTMTC